MTRDMLWAFNWIGNMEEEADFESIRASKFGTGQVDPSEGHQEQMISEQIDVETDSLVQYKFE